MTTEASRELVERSDAAGLIRRADQLAAAEAWEELTELRDLALGSQDVGGTLWPAVARAEYRLALNAPGRWAARVLLSDPGRPTFGPLPEVAASTHTWEELADHVVQGAPEAAIAAHERVVRGEDLRGDRRLDPFLLEIPLALAEWEPAYPLAEYDVDGASFPLAEITGFEPVTLGPAARLAEDHATVRALLDLCTAWTIESNGRAEAVAVHGDVRAAVATLGWSVARMAEITPQQGVAGLAWAAASGGAHGRRRGMARGRFAAWWVAAALGGLLEDFPPDPSELGDAIGELRWWAWEEDDGPTPWTCRLAVEDPADGLAWVISAVDSDASGVGDDPARHQL